MTIRTTSQSRAAKARGRECESMLCDYLRARGWPAERRRLTGDEDLGDIGGIRKLVVECKAHKSLNLPAWLDELAIEVQNADRRYPEDIAHTGLVVARRRGKPHPGDWYAVMSVERMFDLLVLAGWKP